VLLPQLVLIKLLKDLFVVESMLFSLALFQLVLDGDLVIELVLKEFLLVLDVGLAFLFPFVMQILVVPGDGRPFILLAHELELNIRSVLLGLFIILPLLP